MAQRPFPLPIQADKRVSQVSQVSEFSVNSNGSDAKRHKAYIGPWKLGKTLGRGSSGMNSLLCLYRILILCSQVESG